MFDIHNKHFCTIQAPAKAILCGEHAVVYGEDAIAISIGLFCSGRIYRRSKENMQANIFIDNDLNSCPFIVDSRLVNFLEEKHNQKQNYSIEELMKDINSGNKDQLVFLYKLSVFLRIQKIKWNQWISKQKHDFMIKISSIIPIGKCLGSSAAYNSVLAASFYIIFNRLQNIDPSKIKQMINDMSFEFEKIEHGNPSGIDNFVSINGGVIFFNKNRHPKYHFIPNAKTKLKNELNIFIIDSGIQKNTKKAVAKVRQNYDSNDIYKEAIKQIGHISMKIKDLLQKQTQWVDQFLFLIVKNHNILRDLGVSHEKIDQIVEQYSKKGLTIKITGSGLGGCVLAFSKKEFLTEDPKIISAPLQQEGLKITFQQK